MRRNYLFLQGCTSAFFHALGCHLRERGHGVGRVNFNVGDAVLWRAGPAWSFRGQLSELAEFLTGLVSRHGFTDMVMLGDTRPIHQEAIKVAKVAGLVIHVYEEGYFRPGWLTLERDGINGNSRLPKDPDWFRAVGEQVPELMTQQQVPSTPLAMLAAWEVIYHLPNLLNPILYRGYRTHRPVISGIEFYGWGSRFAVQPIDKRRDDGAIDKLCESGQPYFVFPLQLDGDAQITRHSPFKRVSDAIDAVMRSFVLEAPTGCKLVIKNHPLDTGLNHYGRIVLQLANSLDIADRVLFLETGDLIKLLKRAKGVVTINSTVGTAALEIGRPVLTLGQAIYDIPGLVNQHGLEAFWRQPVAPDLELFRLFKRAVIYTTQVNGNFYSKSGNRLAASNSLRFLEPELSPLEAFLA